MINRKYLERIEPENLLEHINNFEEWLDLAETKQDLICTLTLKSKICNKFEL